MAYSKEEFIVRFTELMDQKGYSDRQLSKAVGATPGYINGIRNGRSLPKMEYFFTICDQLGITPAEFFQSEVAYPALQRSVNEQLSKLTPAELQSLQVLLASIVEDR